MKVLDLNTTREFTEGAMKRFFLVEDSEFFKIINFNLKAGVTFPVHSHSCLIVYSTMKAEEKQFVDIDRAV